MPYKVENAEMKKPTKGATFLSLKIDGKSVSFFHSEDFNLPVKVGDMVECKVEKNGNYWNGTELKVLSNTISMNSGPTNPMGNSNDLYLKGIFEQLKRIVDFLYKTPN